MKKNGFEKWKKLRFERIDLAELDDRTLLLNLYATQLITLLAALALLWIQGRHPFGLLMWPDGYEAWLWGAGLAAAVLGVDAAVARWVSQEATDDGGINVKLFGKRSVWHIVLICFVVAVCEETLFRGAIQYWLGPYWTSILFALVHFRYLRHWLMTGIVFSTSYALGWIAIRTGTLWAPIAAHFLIDLTMGLYIRFRKVERP